MTGLPLLEGLPPIAGPTPHVLILGNMPSAMSLASHEYYGNPRNAFWHIMEEIHGIPAGAPYQDRVSSLIERRIAVWDVLHNCRRSGSLDSAVERGSMIANDFVQFYREHDTIGRVFFNGAAAQQNYQRLVGPSSRLTYARLPSTSPAHTMRYADKVNAWRSLG